MIASDFDCGLSGEGNGYFIAIEKTVTACSLKHRIEAMVKIRHTSLELDVAGSSPVNSFGYCSSAGRAQVERVWLPVPRFKPHAIIPTTMFGR
jgi:hypothetical protein